MSNEKIEELQDLIRTRISTLRPKLLDLSRRNPLISTRLSPRSASLLRVVDELPDVLVFRLSSQQKMRFVPLPSLDTDPKDEQSKEFQDALSTARLTDEGYLQALEAIDATDDESIEVQRRIERELKDRVRASLGMEPRQQKADISLRQHALNNDISPHYDLPSADDEHEDGRHEDDDIQTLLLPEDLERRLNALTAKCRTWEQETGINVLHGAFGFLEWSEPNSSESNFAPLVLLPARLEKRKTKAGVEFWINADGDDSETNFVIAEKLRLDYGIDLPRFKGGSVEEYLKEVALAAPPTMKWKVRRQVAFGVFPSARMAMYEDTGRAEIAKNPIIASLFGGTAPGGVPPFADEYDVDDPSVEKKVPFLVLDSDSSQFSTVADVMDGKNLAVEGPPGTGKSQTIINTIANAIANGKKVLFIAEKMAALEVVKSRLEAVGLGEFLLPLQAERSTREQVIASIRSRLEMSATHAPRDYDTKTARYRNVRSELAAYIDSVSAKFGTTGLTVHDVLGKSIATQKLLDDAPRPLQSPQISNVAGFDYLKLAEVREKAAEFIRAWSDADSSDCYWKGVKLVHLDRFTASRMTDRARETAEKFGAACQARQALSGYGIDEASLPEDLQHVLSALQSLLRLPPDLDPILVVRIHRAGAGDVVKAFVANCIQYRAEHETLAAIVIDPNADEVVGALQEIARHCKDYGITGLDSRQWHEDLSSRTSELAALHAVQATISSFVEHFPAAASMPIEALAKADQLVRQSGRDVVGIRNGATADPAAEAPLAALCQRGRELKEKKEQISEFISLSHDGAVSDLRTQVEVFRNAGALSWLSSSFKTAKRAYTTRCKRSRFDKLQAASDLSELADWQEAERDFAEDPQARAIFGLHFKGSETNFGLFEQLASYLKSIEELFPGPTHRLLRTLLKTGDMDLLFSIPNVAIDRRGYTYTTLTQELAKREEELETRRVLVARLETLSRALIRPESVAVRDLDSLVRRLDQLRALRARLNESTEVQDLLKAAFDGHRTNTEQLGPTLTALTIIDEQKQKTLLADLLETTRVESAIRALEQAVEADQLSHQSLLDLESESGVNFSNRLNFSELQRFHSYLSSASQDHRGLVANSILTTARAGIEALGLGWIAKEIESDRDRLEKLVEIQDAVIFRAMAMGVFEIHKSTLSRCRGAALDDWRATLAQLDREIIRLTRQHIRAMLRTDARPPSGNGLGKKSEWTQMALIENEVSKKQRFIPVRDLTRRAGEALLELKPCWMMSPLAVAQYLPPTAEFDLCIIDEASQMPPEDALGGLARCKQVMVVGDTNQLPPTSFFKKMLDDDDVEEDDTVLEESILEMSNGVFRPARRLRWHYRSKHSGLIQFSNEHIYRNDLIVFPSPEETRPDMGVSFVAVDGRYRAGVNPTEASVMIEAAIRFMRTNPDRSLGIVTLNQKQRDLLLEEWERAVARDPAAARYVDDWAERNDGLESFFIKNLENVQGDERDVIFIGTVYGPERPGEPVMQRFGPINGLAGRRRLNVLLSRAKLQTVTFSSMTAADIRADEHSNPGTYMLKRWLEYAATGMLHPGDATPIEPESDFESYVIDQLRSMGCEPVPQVGVAGYRIDIGVRHALWPHGFILGVECDGATYHSARSARDRDRLRQEVLEARGWRLHRIWSTDWFNDPAKEAERLRSVVVGRLNELRSSASARGILKAEIQLPDPPTIDVAGVEQTPSISSEEPKAPQTSHDLHRARSEGVEIGDTVTVRYLTGERTVRDVTLSEARNDPVNGIVHIDEPLGRALIDMEKGEEIEVLVGNIVRRAVIEDIKKGKKIEGVDKQIATQPVEIRAVQSELQLARSESGFNDTALDPHQFYEKGYLRTLRPYACKLIDEHGPITFRHLSELIARAHGFQRTGSQIKKQVWAAVSKARHVSRTPDGESVFWPDKMQPTQLIKFRGMTTKGEARDWQHVPHPEKLGLAVEVLNAHHGRDPIGKMTDRIGLTRLRQPTREEFEKLINEAKSHLQQLRNIDSRSDP